MPIIKDEYGDDGRMSNSGGMSKADLRKVTSGYFTLCLQVTINYSFHYSNVDRWTWKFNIIFSGKMVSSLPFEHLIDFIL